MEVAHRDFKKQHPRPVPGTPPYAPNSSKQGDGPGCTANPTTGTERSQTHTDHRHPPRGKMAHTEAPHDPPRPTEGPPRLPEHAAHMFGL